MGLNRWLDCPGVTKTSAVIIAIIEQVFLKKNQNNRAIWSEASFAPSLITFIESEVTNYDDRYCF